MRNVAYILFSMFMILTISCKDENIVYNTAARAGFTVGEQYEVGQPITFTDETVPESGTQIVSYLWEFGDEAESTSGEKSPTFTYKKDGIFIVKLTVTDSNGLKATSQKEIKVINPTSPDFSVDKADYQMGEEIHFTDATVVKEGITITAYLWEFGDANKSTSTERNPTFVYTEAGAYAVKLTVQNSFGLSASVTKNITVFDPSKAIAILWSAPILGSITGGSSPALAADGSAVYMLTGGSDTSTGLLNAYQISSGTALWTLDIDKAMKEKHDGGSSDAGAKDIYGSPSVGKNGDIYFVARDLKDSGTNRRLFMFAVNKGGSVNWAYAGPDANVYSITPAIDASGNIFIAHRAGKIWKFTANGEHTEFVSNGVKDFTSGISLAKDGTLYATGKGNAGIVAYDWTSQSEKFVYSTDFGGAADAFIGALKSSSVTIGTDGTIYSVTDLSTGGAILALNPDGTEKWVYKTVGAIPDGGVALGADGTIYANGGVIAGAKSAGVIALNPDGTIKWHFSTEESVQTSPLVDDRGYIHFVTAKATYFILKPDDGSVFSSMTLGDEVTSTPVMDEIGNLYVPVKKEDGALYMLCVTSKATSYAKDSAWPMKGQNPQRTGLQQ